MAIFILKLLKQLKYKALVGKMPRRGNAVEMMERGMTEDEINRFQLFMRLY